MADHKYRFRCPDGQVFETDDLRKMRRAHPDAVVIARIDFDDLGVGHLTDFDGDPGPANTPVAAPAPPPEAPVDAAPATDAAPKRSHHKKADER
jgi:hypothetical protein